MIAGNYITVSVEDGKITIVVLGTDTGEVFRDFGIGGGLGCHFRMRVGGGYRVVALRGDIRVGDLRACGIGGRSGYDILQEYVTSNGAKKHDDRYDQCRDTNPKRFFHKAIPFRDGVGVTVCYMYCSTFGAESQGVSRWAME